MDNQIKLSKNTQNILVCIFIALLIYIFCSFNTNPYNGTWKNGYTTMVIDGNKGYLKNGNVKIDFTCKVTNIGLELSEPNEQDVDLCANDAKTILYTSQYQYVKQ